VENIPLTLRKLGSAEEVGAVLVLVLAEAECSKGGKLQGGRVKVMLVPRKVVDNICDAIGYKVSSVLADITRRFCTLF
jgi:hypothetical protein